MTDATPTNTPDSPRPKTTLFLSVALLVVAADLASKEWAFSEGRMHRTAVDGVLYITPVHNDGVVWGAFQGTNKNVLFIIISSAAVPIIVRLFATFRERLAVAAFALGGVLGGTLGNLYDRIVHTAVRDYLEINVVRWNFHWPIFNVADAFICTGAILFALCVVIRKEGKAPATGALAGASAPPPQG